MYSIHLTRAFYGRFLCRFGFVVSVRFKAQNNEAIIVVTPTRILFYSVDNVITREVRFLPHNLDGGKSIWIAYKKKKKNQL